jgi:hypothetical protein
VRSALALAQAERRAAGGQSRIGEFQSVSCRSQPFFNMRSSKVSNYAHDSQIRYNLLCSLQVTDVCAHQGTGPPLSLVIELRIFSASRAESHCFSRR